MSKRAKKLPVVLNKDEQDQLLKQPNSRYPTGQRNYTILKLMLDTGLRLSELTNLKWRDLELMSGKLMVGEGKGAIDRTLWVSEEVLDLLTDWKERQVEELKERKIVEKPEYVFTTLKGKKLKNRYVREMVYRTTDKADINKKVSPHTLRHTFATDLYRKTNNIRMVQKALGHSDLSTTMIYTHIVDDELEEAMKGLRKD